MCIYIYLININVLIKDDLFLKNNVHLSIIHIKKVNGVSTN